MPAQPMAQNQRTQAPVQQQQSPQRNAWGQRRQASQQAPPQQRAPAPQRSPVRQQQQQRSVPAQPVARNQTIPVNNQRLQAPIQRQAPAQQKRQAPVQQQQPPRRRPSPVQQRTSPGNQDYVAPHRRSGSITRTSTYMGAHGPQSIRGSRSLSRDPSRGQQQQTRRSSSRDAHRQSPQQGRAVARERPMPAQTMARNQSIPLNNNQSVYQHQPVTQQHRPTPVVQQQATPMDPSLTVFVTNLPATVTKAQFCTCLQQNNIPPPTAMGKDRQHNIVWCTFSHSQYALTALNANLQVQGVQLNVTRPQNAI